MNKLKIYKKCGSEIILNLDSYDFVEYNAPNQTINISYTTNHIKFYKEYMMTDSWLDLIANFDIMEKIYE